MIRRRGAQWSAASASGRLGLGQVTRRGAPLPAKRVAFGGDLLVARKGGAMSDQFGKNGSNAVAADEIVARSNELADRTISIAERLVTSIYLMRKHFMPPPRRFHRAMVANEARILCPSNGISTAGPWTVAPGGPERILNDVSPEVSRCPSCAVSAA